MEMRNFSNNSVGDGLQITRDDKRTSVYAQGAVLSLEAYQMPPYPAFYSLTHLPLDEMATISQPIFSDAFCEWIVVYSNQNVTKVCF